jgi:hypothetical protein
LLFFGGSVGAPAFAVAALDVDVVVDDDVGVDDVPTVTSSLLLLLLVVVVGRMKQRTLRIW